MDIALAARNLGIGREELLELLEIFLDASGADLDALAAAMAGGNLREVAAVAHSLKGAALNLELQDIAAQARTLEAAAINAALPGTEDLLEELRENLKELAYIVKS
jgi:HPt (histidine-containing phosphotransfer) domain-containing protein